MIAYELDLNLRPGGVLPRLNVSQYDKGQTVTCVLWDGNTAFTLPNGSAAYVVGTKPDGTGFEYSCSYQNAQPVFTITEQMTPLAGEVTCELRIITTDERQGTINFILDVEKSALDSNAPISETDIPIIQQLPEILAEVQAAEQLAHEWATGGATGETPSATNNAYYWAMQAASYAGGGLRPEVVQNLPTTNISTTTLYFVPSSDPSQSNFYDEYINIDGTTQGWELIGTTAVDLTDYYTKTEVDAAVGGVQDDVDAITGGAEEFSPTKNYVVGDMCYYQGALYRFIGAHTGAWDDLYVDPIDLNLMENEIKTISTQLTPIIINEASDGSWCLRKQGKRMILQMFGITGNNLININVSAYPPHSPASTTVVTRDNNGRRFGMVYVRNTGINGYDLPTYGSGVPSDFGPNYGPAVSGTLEWYID